MLLLLLLNLVFTGPDTLHVYHRPEVVITATRTPIKSIDAPSSVVRIDVDKMKTAGFYDVKSMLSLVDGMFVKDYGPAQLTTVSLRGTGSEQTLFLLDGVSLNNIQNGNVDLFLVPISDLSAVEVSESGSSALYGANAVGGVVSLESKTTADNMVRINLGGGSFGTQTLGGEISEGIGAARVDLTAQRRRAVNNYDFTFDNSATSTQMQRTGADYVIDNQSLKVTLPSSSGLTSLLVQNVDANRGTPGMVTDPSFVGTAREIDKNTFAVLRNTGSLSDLNYSASAGVTYSYLQYIDPTYTTNDYYKMLSLQPAVQMSYSDTHISTAAGVDAELDRGQSTEMIGIKNRDRAGLFASGMYDLLSGSNWETRVFGAVRFDSYSDFGSSFNPKLGINVKPLASFPIHLRATAGTSFRVPTFNELYYAGLGNAALQPEKSTEYDLGAVAEFTDDRMPIGLAFEASYYHIDIRDGIVWRPVTDLLWLPENYSRILSRGVELSARVNYKSLLSLKGNYSFGNSLDLSDPSDPSTYEKQQLYIPQEQGSLVAEVSPWILNFTAAAWYVGKRYYSTDNTQSLPAYSVADISVSAHIDAGAFEIVPVLSMHNLFNREYEVIPQYPVPMRTYRFGLSFQFNQDADDR